MFKILFQIILIIYIIFLFFNILDLKKYNVNGFIKSCIDHEDILLTIRNLNPVLLHHENEYIINDIIIDHGEHIENIVFKDREQINIEENKPLLNIIDKEKIPFFLTGSKIPTINNESISIYKNHIGKLESCNSNNTIIYIVDGETTLNLFNPKHKEEIIDKENNKIKKWGHKKIIKKNDILLIPPYWHYIQECENEIIQYHIDIDNIFTFIPNKLRNI